MEQKRRNTVIDQIKGLLIFLVVMGHFAHWQNEYDYSALWGGVYNAIMSFHMPAFIFISGYFSKNIDRHRMKELDLLFFPYIVFQLLNFLYTSITGWGDVGRAYTHFSLSWPIYQNWYILSLFIWRLLLPYLRMFKKRYAIVFVFIMAFLGGFDINLGQTLALHRMLYFFPIFVLGYYCDDFDDFMSRFSHHIYFFAGLFLISIIAIFIISQNYKYSEIISFAYTPLSGHLSSIKPFVARLAGFCSSMAIFFSFLIVATAISKKYKNRLLIEMEQQSMLIYLVHGFVIFACVPIIMTKICFVLQLFLSLLLSILICYFFSRNKVNSIFRPLMSFKGLCSFYKHQSCKQNQLR